MVGQQNLQTFLPKKAVVSEDNHREIVGSIRDALDESDDDDNRTGFRDGGNGKV